MSLLKAIMLVLVSCMITVSFAACEKQGPAERAAEKIDKAVEKAGDKIEKAGEKLKESTKE